MSSTRPHRPQNRTQLSACPVSARCVTGRLCSSRPAGFQRISAVKLPRSGHPGDWTLRGGGKGRQLPSQPASNPHRSGLQRSTSAGARKGQCCTRALQRRSGRSDSPASRFPSVRGRPGAARLRAAGARCGPLLGGPVWGVVNPRKAPPLFSATPSAASPAPCQYKDKSPPPWRGLRAKGRARARKQPESLDSPRTGARNR
jgi:hypothetical protein